MPKRERRVRKDSNVAQFVINEKQRLDDIISIEDRKSRLRQYETLLEIYLNQGKV